MRTVARALVPALLVTLILTTIASADTIYTYAGDYFSAGGGFVPSHVAGVYTTADRITGSFTVADGFVPGVTQGGAAFTGGGNLQAPDGSYSPAPSVGGVLGYSFTDGHQTLTQANSTAIMYLGIPIEALNLVDGGCSPCLYRYQLGAGWPDGFQPTSWAIQIATPTSWIVTSYEFERGDLGRLDADNFGGNGSCSYYGCDGSHLGTWTVSVPEPMTLLLVFAGIGGIALAHRRRRI